MMTSSDIKPISANHHISIGRSVNTLLFSIVFSAIKQNPLD